MKNQLSLFDLPPVVSKVTRKVLPSVVVPKPVVNTLLVPKENEIIIGSKPLTFNEKSQSWEFKITYSNDLTRNESGDYANYLPQIMVEGSKDHPTALCESLAMSDVPLPPTRYIPDIPHSVIRDGLLSNAQLEDIILAGQRHSEMIHLGKFRKGYMIGSGTGFGKGNAISGIIMDNFRNGRTKAIWISKNDKSHLNSLDYWRAVGGNKSDFIEHSKIKTKDKIIADRGILATNYGLLRSKFSLTEVEEEVFIEGRVKQIMDWLGPDFDGIIAFDESHMMANAIDTKGTRGIKKGSLVAQVGLALQKFLPMARIIYSSATGATEIENLTYAPRLGIFGPGTPFETTHDFIDEIKKSGVSAMELVARDLKAQGLYTAKSLSYAGVDYESLIHIITPAQKELYDTLAKSWQIVLANIHDAIENNNSSKGARSAAMSAFWGAHQRFFSLIILTIQLPTVAEDIQKSLDEGHSVIIQLTNTNEAQTTRAIADMKGQNLANNTELNLDELDISPKSILVEFIAKSFPVTQFESYIDEYGNESQRPCYTSDGEIIQNAESVRQRDYLVNLINEELVIPQGPLDSFLQIFGHENVAEVTGRTVRVVDKNDLFTGEQKKVEERRTPAHSRSEIQEFLDDKRKILIFSEAGGTGGSFHADARIKNRRKRIHYAFQLGWRADIAVQGFGRSHRSNQVETPTFKLCSTNISAQKRFLSSIARRLEQLGALTKGQRTTGGQGILDNSYNFESNYAKEALQLLYYDILATGEPLSIKDLKEMMGLTLTTKDDSGQVVIKSELLQDIKKFLNRILSLEIDVMNRVFEAFESKMQALINQAKSAGTYDTGIEHIKSVSTTVLEEIPIYTDPTTLAKSYLTTLKLIVKNSRTTFEEEDERSQRFGKNFIGYFIQKNSEIVYACYESNSACDENGKVTNYVRKRGCLGDTYLSDNELYLSHNMISREDAMQKWNLYFESIPETKIEIHSIIKGLILPIWKKIPGEIRVHRYQDNNGKTHLGRFVSQGTLSSVRSQFDLKYILSVSEILSNLNHGREIVFTNKAVMKACTIQGINSIEFTSINSSSTAILQEFQFIIRIQNKLMDIKSAYIPKEQFLETYPKVAERLLLEIATIRSKDED